MQNERKEELYLSLCPERSFLGLESDAFVGDAVGISTSEGGSIVR